MPAYALYMLIRDVHRVDDHHSSPLRPTLPPLIRLISEDEYMPTDVAIRFSLTPDALLPLTLLR